MLFLEELQSDLHQQGRKEGYRPSGSRIMSFYEWGVSRGMPEQEINTIWHTDDPVFLQWQRENQQAFKNASRPPDIPFKKDWHELVGRRMLRWAAEHGYDSLGWTTGEQQAERYNQILRDVDKIYWDGGGEEGSPESSAEYGLTIKMRNGTERNMTVPKDQLADYLGIQMANKIKDQEKEGKTYGDIAGEGISIGGHGMKGFYDKMLVDFFNKFGKKWGARVQSDEIQTGYGIDYKIPSSNAVTGTDLDVLSLRAKDRGGFATAMQIHDWANIMHNHGTKLDAILDDYKSMDESTTGGAAVRFIVKELGGTINPDRNRVKVHSLPITPAMKKSALEEGVPIAENSRTAPPPEVEA